MPTLALNSPKVLCLLFCPHFSPPYEQPSPVLSLSGSFFFSDFAPLFSDCSLGKWSQSGSTVDTLMILSPLWLFLAFCSAPGQGWPLFGLAVTSPFKPQPRVKTPPCNFALLSLMLVFSYISATATWCNTKTDFQHSLESFFIGFHIPIIPHTRRKQVTMTILVSLWILCSFLH